MQHPPTDMVRVVVIVGNVVFRADVTIGRAASRLDEFEQNVGQALARMTRGRTGGRPPDLTDATRQMIAFGARQELPGWLIIAAMWLAIRGRGTPVSLDELVARARRVCLTITCNDLQSSAARPAIIGQIRPTFDETVEGHKPEISETRTGLFETDPQSSPPAHIP